MLNLQEYSLKFWRHQLTRRKLLGSAVAGGLGLAAAATIGCGDGEDGVAPTAPPGAVQLAPPGPIQGVVPAELEQVSADIHEIQFAAGAATATGTVIYRLHQGFFNGEKAYFIRSDASEEQFAKDHGLVFAMLMEEALDVRGPQGERAVGDLYYFRTGASDQLPILSTIPGQDDYTPLFQVHWVTSQAGPTLLTSVADIQSAQSEGKVTLEDTPVIVNYPVVKWPGGEMPNTTELDPYLGDGQLLGPVDVPGMRVTFKLHRCFPEHLYIVTDTSNPAMADGMKIVHSPRTALLSEAGPGGTAAAMAQVFVFGNGPEGDGPMGFQSSMMDPELKDESWSPLWNHFTVTWKDESQATLLTDLEDFKARVDREEFEVFNGVPDTHPQGFAVNCAVPAILRAT